MATFSLTFSMDGAAFFDNDPRAEVRRILGEVAIDVLAGDGETIRDSNGNSIGRWAITEEDY